MSTKFAAAIIADMLEAADAVQEAVAGESFADFEKARVARLAVQRAIEIISEAARRLPDDLIDRHPTAKLGVNAAQRLPGKLLVD